ncbi:MAG: alanine racemase [Pyrinomonadaceae bacterium]|nr:alanine racemase [Pyrinomonadaceae bacterium]
MTDATFATRPTIAEIDLGALGFNFRSVREFVGSDVRYMGVVKANAYGHGAVECSRRLESEGIDWLAVALVEEGIELRAAGIKAPILCLGGFWPGQEAAVISHDLTPVIFRADLAETLNRAAAVAGRTIDVHVKVDTGMGRVGIRPDELSTTTDRLKACANLKLDGVMTHFAVADDLEQNDFTNSQIEQLKAAAEYFRERGFALTHIDMANSPGAVAHPASLGNMVRLGGVLYGLGGDVLPTEVAKPELRPVMSLHSRIAQVKTIAKGESVGYGRTFTASGDATIATVPIGYNDGYRRALSNKATAIVNGVLVPVVGRISMDWITLDVTSLPEVKVGDEVSLIGSSGDARIRVEDLSAVVGTISYEITCGISSRVPRHYIT